MPLRTPKAPKSSLSQPSIQTYSQVTKPGATTGQSKNKNTSQQSPTVTAVVHSRKRKISPEAAPSGPQTAAKRQRKDDVFVRALQAHEKHTNREPVSPPQRLPRPEPEARPIPSLPEPTSQPQSGPSTRPEPPQCTKITDLPPPLQDLTHLHRSLVRALSLHFAHHGTVSPAPLSTILPSASRIWGRRTIQLDDVRRCWALLGRDGEEFDSLLDLWDYGRGGVCFELAVPVALDRGRAGVSITRAFDEEALQSSFERVLVREWMAAGESGRLANEASPRETAGVLKTDERDNDEDEDEDEDDDEASTAAAKATAFISALPQHTTPKHPSLSKSRTPTSLNLGQTRLDSLLRTPHRQKHPSADASGLLTPTSAHSPDPGTPSRSTPSRTPTTPRDRTSALLARLSHKAAATPTRPALYTTIPSSPAGRGTTLTPTQLSSLHKLPSIITTLTLLSSRPGGRRAFGLKELVRLVRESAPGGHVIEEGVVVGALGMLSGDLGLGGGDVMGEALAGDFVKVVRVGGGVLGIVIDGAGRGVGLEGRVRGVIEGLGVGVDG